MSARLLTLAAASIIAIQAASAQEAVELPEIVIDRDISDSGGYLGPTTARESSTATRTQRPVAETPRSISIETEQNLADKGARSLEDALGYTSGVRAGSYGFDPRGNWTVVRGFQPTEFLDGLQSTTGGYYDNTLPEIFALERVEVLKGPSGMLYGNGSVGGILNAVTKRPKADTFVRVGAEYGSFDQKQGTVDANAPLNDAGTVLGRFVGLYRDAETQVDFSRNDAILIAPSITFAPTADTQLTILGHYQKNDNTPDVQFFPLDGTLYPSPDGRFLPTGLFVGEPGFDRLDAEQVALTLDGEHRFNDVWKIDAIARYSESNADYDHAWWSYGDQPTRYKPDGTIDRTFFSRDGHTGIFAADGHLTGTFVTGAVGHTLLMGTAFTRASYDDDDSPEVTGRPIDPFGPVYTGAPDLAVTDTPAVTFEQLGFYVQDEMEINRNLLVTAGLRWDAIETDNPLSGAPVSDSALSGNLSLMYRFDNGVAPYVSYSESFRQESTARDAAGNTFDPTEGEQVEVGVKYQPPGTDSLFTAALFDLTKSNMLVSDPANPLFQVQTGEAQARGIELEGQWTWRDVAFEANYTHLDAATQDGAPLDTVPDDLASLWAVWRPSGVLEGFKLGGGVRYVGASESADGYGGFTETPSYTLGDAMIGYETGRWDLTLNITNLTDEIYVASGGYNTGYYGERRKAVVRLTGKF